MTKSKSNAVIMTANVAGGMSPILDWRFDTGEWPISFVVPSVEADAWLRYLSAQCTKRGWGCASFGQRDARENSGSITVSTRDADSLQLAVIWERKRAGPIKVRAKSVGTPGFSLDQARALFDEVNEQSRTRTLQQVYQCGQLRYEGLPWRGELWLGETLRLGPPSNQDEAFRVGPRVILVHAFVDAIDAMHSAEVVHVVLRELSVFLSVVMGTHVRVAPNSVREWTWEVDPSGKTINCEVRATGYLEQNWPATMPAKGANHSIPLDAVPRPDWSLRGDDGTRNEQHLPADTADLWQTLAALSVVRRRQFMQVGSMWQLAISLGHEYQTARFAWMVGACEALKPPARSYRRHNIYHVVEALLGSSIAALMQESWFRPQGVRNAHLHSGELRGSEFMEHAMMSSFQDPTFDRAYRVLYDIAQAAIIEWLRKRGAFTMPSLTSGPTHAKARRRG